MRKPLLAYLGMMFFCLLIGCDRSKPAFNSIDITGNAQFGKDFSLIDSQGKMRHLADFRGKVVLLFFGYTQCPDVCPSTLAEMRAVMEQLGTDADKLQVIFISLDPKRDTAALLTSYVASFHSHFIALRPRDEDELKKITHDFRVYASHIPSKDSRYYTIDHTAGSFVFDSRGILRLFVRHGQDATLLTKDIRLLINE